MAMCINRNTKNGRLQVEAPTHKNRMEWEKMVFPCSRCGVSYARGYVTCWPVATVRTPSVHALLSSFPNSCVLSSPLLPSARAPPPFASALSRACAALSLVVSSPTAVNIKGSARSVLRLLRLTPCFFRWSRMEATAPSVSVLTQLSESISANTNSNYTQLQSTERVSISSLPTATATTAYNRCYEIHWLCTSATIRPSYSK